MAIADSMLALDCCHWALLTREVRLGIDPLCTLSGFGSDPGDLAEKGCFKMTDVLPLCSDSSVKPNDLSPLIPGTNGFVQ